MLKGISEAMKRGQARKAINLCKKAEKAATRALNNGAINPVLRRTEINRIHCGMPMKTLRKLTRR